MNAVERLATQASRHATSVFLVDAVSGREFTYGDVASVAGAAGHFLAGLGLRPGDRVALALPNGVAIACLYFTCWLNGYTALPVNPLLPAETMEDILCKGGAKVLVTSKESESGRKAGVPQGCHRLCLGDEIPEGFESWAPLALEAAPLDDALPDPSLLMTLSFTSGTTAEPKGVAHRFEGMVANAEAFRDMNALGSANRFFNVLPMTYMAGFYNLLLLPWLCGGSVVVSDTLGPREALTFWPTARRHNVNTLWLVPTILSILVKMNRSDDPSAWPAEHVRRCFVGTAPLPAPLRREFEELFGLKVLENYGLSETLFLTANTTGENRPGTVGRPVPGMGIRLVGEDGNDVAPGCDGDLVVDSPMLMAGYLEGEDIVPPEVPFPTGDVGRMDADGYISITGRKKNVIIRGGENVSPLRIEEVVLSCRGVDECAVVGIPHPEYGEAIGAVVVVSRPYAEVIRELSEVCRKKLGPHEPNVYFEIDALPRTSNGKVDKKSIRALLAERTDFNGRREAPRPAAPQAQRRVIDLSQDLSVNMKVFPSGNHPGFELEKHVTIPEAGRQVSRVVMGTHTGTHVDAPVHFIEGGGDITQTPLSVFVGPARMIDFTDLEPATEISLDMLKARVGGRPPERLILRFGWNISMGMDTFFKRHPYISTEAARWIAQNGVRLLGMDSPQPDDPRSVAKGGPDSPVHKILLGSGVTLLEYLCNLDAVQSEEFEIIALPLKLKDADGSPVRCVAIDHF
ncbi:putative sulfoacetate--CoA ligase [Pseudodesulfovibrio hydrargyri]|uniref:Kynurenine formamidase n=1 Tax=Pseudodesulfovibrio hydrargyri TaxID=2125990 RepID=A0A1J5NEB5_9BACT|nr:AMP-binding protein [Pseudodesulfovibrio hydrargyri]OIQ50057.1 putative sulfoacetate--CoA ligase [Pseudodesulfovibrio hydrargyri]